MNGLFITGFQKELKIANPFVNHFKLVGERTTSVFFYRSKIQ